MVSMPLQSPQSPEEPLPEGSFGIGGTERFAPEVYDWPEPSEVDQEDEKLIREAAGDEALLNMMRGRRQAEDRYYDELERLGRDGGQSPELDSAGRLLAEIEQAITERKIAIGLISPDED